MNTSPKGRNLVGIIPLAGWKNKLDFPWPDYLHPLREGFTAIERSVYECAYAGCDSIWIVCNDDFAPIVKKTVGDYVMSPRFFEEKNFVKRKDYHQKWVPIYYTPVPQKHRGRRDSMAWSILQGSLTAFQLSDRLSKWCRPSKFFVSFPYGIYHPGKVKENRTIIRGPESVFLSHEENTAKDGKYLAFTFFPEDWIKFKRSIKSQCTGGDKSLPAHERWSSKDFSIDKIFKFDTIEVQNKLEIENYYTIDSWESILDYYKSDIKIPRPTKQFMKPYFFKQGYEHEQ